MQNTGDNPQSILEIAEFLQRPDIEQCFLIHPNQLTSPSFSPPPDWLYWWHWAAEPSNVRFIDATGESSEPRWLNLWRYYTRTSSAEDLDNTSFQSIPIKLRNVLDLARKLKLPRDSNFQVPTSSRTQGMSSKKAHEVICMSSYISRILSRVASKRPIRHVVDVGAGQAYLSRTLRDELGLHVLALDWSDVQCSGAARKDSARSKVLQLRDPCSVLTDKSSEGSLDYRTIHITPGSLLSTTDGWVNQSSPCYEAETSQARVPVLLVALHACGSLTLDILRAYVSRHQDREGPNSWEPDAALIVGCCYNLLRPEDRHTLRAPFLVLTSNHLQLAAQTPEQWARTPDKLLETRLSVRKVVWRALLEGILAKNSGLSSNGHETTEHDTENVGRKRLGRLHDKVYANWSQFLCQAQERLSTDLSQHLNEPIDRVMESRLEVFHVLRCILGPVVESLILLDRKQWLEEELLGSGMEVELINLFDQSSGSGRNVAIAITSGPEGSV